MIVQAIANSYRLYVGTDRRTYCHYDTGEFPNLDVAVKTAKQGFNPDPFLAFPDAPFSRAEVLDKAPDAFEALER